MLRQEKSKLPSPQSSEFNTHITNKKSHRKLYALFATLAIIVAIVGALLIPQSTGSPMQLTLNYNVGDHMVYSTTNVVMSQMVNTSLSLPSITNSQSLNSTITLDVVSSNSENYTIKENIAVTPDSLGQYLPHSMPTLTLNVSKASYYNNFIAPGGPLIFSDANNDPTFSAFLAQSGVKVGDVWKIPINTGNASLGLTGEVTLTFAGLQDLTVPGGTFKTMRIEITSNILSVHSDGSSILKIPDGMTLQLHGTSYIEQGTCRLIKADLTQVTTTNSPTVGSTSTWYTEKILVEYSKL